MSLFSKPKYSTVTVKKKDIPEGLWRKCPLSGEIIFNKELEQNQNVVPKSGHHFLITAPERIPELLRRALRISYRGRPGVVHLDVATLAHG